MLLLAHKIQKSEDLIMKNVKSVQPRMIFWNQNKNTQQNKQIKTTTQHQFQKEKKD